MVVMARAPRRGSVHQALEPVLGPDGCLALQGALLLRAVGWAREVAGEAVYAAYEPADARTELATLLGPDVRLFPQNGDGIASRTAAASAQVFASGERPLLIVWPDLPRLSPAHAAAALDDLRGGAHVVLGPVFDGGLYLIGIARPTPALFALPERSWRSPDFITTAITAAHEAGLGVGLLRPERALHRPADLRAALIDPLLPSELGRILRRRP